MKPWWDLFYAAYRGSPHVFKYLRPHRREHIDNYKARKERAYYLNFTETVVNLTVSFVFSRNILRMSVRPDVQPEKTIIISPKPPELDQFGNPLPPTGPPEVPKPEEYAALVKVPRDPSDDDVEALWSDADMLNHSMNEFMQEAAIFAKVFGKVDVLVDMPKSDTTLATEQDRKAQGLRPYLVLYYPWDMVNWETDEIGEYLWVRFRQVDTSENDPFAERRKFPTEIYTTWTRSGWVRHRFTFDMHGTPTGWTEERGKHNVGVVPVIPVYNQRQRSTVVGLSAIRDIAPINLAILAYSTLVDEDGYEKTLNILVMQRPLTEDTKEVQLSAHNVLEYTGQNPPSYLAPSGTPMAMLAEHIGRLRDEIYRLSRLGSAMGLLTKEAKSGLAYSYEFNETAQMLAETANTLEQAEHRIHQVFLKWLGREWRGVVDYPDEFGVEFMKDELETLQLSKTNVRSVTFKREMEKEVARKLTSKLPREVRARIAAEIDQMPEPPPPSFFPMG